MNTGTQPRTYGKQVRVTADRVILVVLSIGFSELWREPIDDRCLQRQPVGRR